MSKSVEYQPTSPAAPGREAVTPRRITRRESFRPLALMAAGAVALVGGAGTAFLASRPDAARRPVQDGTTGPAAGALAITDQDVALKQAQTEAFFQENQLTTATEIVLDNGLKLKVFTGEGMTVNPNAVRNAATRPFEVMDSLPPEAGNLRKRLERAKGQRFDGVSVYVGIPPSTDTYWQNGHIRTISDETEPKDLLSTNINGGDFSTKPRFFSLVLNAGAVDGVSHKSPNGQPIALTPDEAILVGLEHEMTHVWSALGDTDGAHNIKAEEPFVLALENRLIADVKASPAPSLLPIQYPPPA